MLNIDKETQKILYLLKTNKIQWGTKYEGEGYTVYLSEYDKTADTEDNLLYAKEEITHQLAHQPQE